MSEKMRPSWFKGVVEGGKDDTAVPEVVAKAESSDVLGKAIERIEGGNSVSDAFSDVVKDMFLDHIGMRKGTEMLGVGNVDKSARQYAELVRNYDIEMLRNFRDHPDTKKKPAFLLAIKDELRRRVLSGENIDQ